MTRNAHARAAKPFIYELAAIQMLGIAVSLAASFALAAAADIKASADTGTKTKIVFPSMTCLGEGTPAFKCERIAVTAYLFIPTTRTNKMVLISHGSRGVDARHFEYAEAN